MFSRLLPLVLLPLLAAVAAWATWQVHGPPDRTVACDPMTIPEGEICLEEVPSEGVLWIDARPRKKWLADGHPHSILLTDDRSENWDDLLAVAAERVFTAEVVVIYCGSKGCGSSEAVAEKLRDIDLGPEIRILHGGWQALAAAGLATGAQESS